MDAGAEGASAWFDLCYPLDHPRWNFKSRRDVSIRNHAVNEAREQILRIKGLAGFREKGGAPALLHAVQDKFYPVTGLNDWPSDDYTSRLVFIGRDLDVDWLNAKFDSLCL